MLLDGQQYDYIFVGLFYGLFVIDSIFDLVFEYGLLVVDGLFVMEYNFNYSYQDYFNYEQEWYYGKIIFSFFGYIVDE